MTKVVKKAQAGKAIKDSTGYNTPSAWADMHGFKTQRENGFSQQAPQYWPAAHS